MLYKKKRYELSVGLIERVGAGEGGTTQKHIMKRDIKRTLKKNNDGKMFIIKAKSFNSELKMIWGEGGSVQSSSVDMVHYWPAF